jgi:antitoxin CcdA
MAIIMFSRSVVMNYLYDYDAPKQTAHLSINSDLLRQAKEEKINLSQTLEKYLSETIREKRRQTWLKESSEAVEEYALFVEKHGCFGDTLRSF